MDLDAITSDARSRDDAESFLGTDRFLVQRRLGAGAYGVVYEAYDRERDALIALKMLRWAEADALYRFKKAFRSLADIRHPNLVSLQELLEEDGHWFLVLELIDGIDFIRYLERFDGSDRFDRIRDATAQLARGLTTLHGHGKLHRDIKPSNVLVTPQGRVVLLDFGLVAELGPGGRQESAAVPMAGTPIYISPEQAEAKGSTPATDWYSVGVMLYEALVGRIPFEGSLVEIIDGKKRGLDRRILDLVPQAPEDLAAICQGLLIPAPASRMGGEEVLRRLASASASALHLESRTRLPLPRRQIPFVGRGESLAALRQAFEASRQRAVAVGVHGASGMGKTSLVRHFLDGVTATDPTAVLLTGRCYRQESVPYKGVDSLVDALSRYLKGLPQTEIEALLPADIGALVRLFPVLGRVPALAAHGSVPAVPDAGPQAARRRAMRALRTLLGGIAAAQPLVLFIDDIHWGDRDSADLLVWLLRPPAAPRVLLICAWRSAQRLDAPLIRALEAQHSTRPGVDFREVAIDHLEPAEAGVLAAALIGPQALDEQIASVVEEAGGSPLFLAELARFASSRQGRDSLDDRPDDRPDDSPDDCPDECGEVRLGDLILARVADLAPPARALLEVLAVAGRPLEIDVLRQAAALGAYTEDALAALRGARLVRLRRGTGDEVEIYHERIRDALLEKLDGATLRRHHQALAVALESSGRAEPETLAVHFQMTEDRERAGDYAASAAARAERTLAFARAARLYRLALDLLPSHRDDRPTLVVKLASALANAGRSREAADTYLAAVRDAGYLDPIELQRNAAEKLLISGHIDRGLAVLRHVLRSVDMGLHERPWRALAELWARRLRLRIRGLRYTPRLAESCDDAVLRRIDICWSVAIGLCLVDVVQASLFHARQLELALHCGEPERVARALAMEIFFGALEGGDSQRARARAAVLADRATGTYEVGLTELAAGMARCIQGEWLDANKRLAVAERYLRETGGGVAWELDTAAHFRVLSRLYRGGWQSLFSELPDLLEHARERGDRYLEVHLLLWVGCWRDLAADDPDAAITGAEQAIGRWSHVGFHYQHFGHLMATVQAQLYGGATGEVWDALMTRWPHLARSLVQRIPLVYVQSYDLRARCALAAARAGGSTQMRRQWLGSATRDARRLRRTGLGWAAGLASSIEAGVAAISGRSAAAIDAADDAERAFRASAMQLHAAAAQFFRGHLLADAAGEALVVEATAGLHAEGIRAPARLVAVLAPGLDI